MPVLSLIKLRAQALEDKRKLTGYQESPTFQEMSAYLEGVSYIHFRCDAPPPICRKKEDA